MCFSDSQPADQEEDGVSTVEDGVSTLEDGGSTVEDSVCPTDEGVLTLDEARRVIKELRDRHRAQSHQLLAWKRRFKAQVNVLRTYCIFKSFIEKFKYMIFCHNDVSCSVQMVILLP